MYNTDKAEFLQRTISDAQKVPVAANINKRRSAYLAVKRLGDILVSALALVLLSPVFLVVAALIKREDKGPALYVSNRVGKNGKIFKMYKFRSMCVDADKRLEGLKKLNERDGPAFKLHNDPRVTSVGRFIRKTCIDELPQLLNILKGDMSMVGPRPPLPAEYETYTQHQKERLAVKPGLTCYWQVHKGEQLSFDQWVELDLKYIQERSLMVDLKLIFRTVGVVLSARGEG